MLYSELVMSIVRDVHDQFVTPRRSYNINQFFNWFD